MARKPFGLERDEGEINALLKEGAEKKSAQAMAADPELPPLPANGEVGRGRDNSFDNIKATAGGTDPSYIVRRLNRDNPGIAEALARGLLSTKS